jgi:sugar phosphate isomerase/epimerase
MNSGNIGIGIDSYAYHRYFGETTQWEKPLGIRWETTDFLRRAHELGVAVVSLQTAYLPELTAPVLASLRQQLESLTLQPVLAWGHPDGLQGGTNPDRVDELRRLLPAATAIGCSIVRLVCGNQLTSETPAARRIERLTPILRELTGEAEALGLTLAIENHADFAMRDLVALVEAVGRSRLGICFDTGNAVRVGDDLLTVARLAAPFVKMVHLKDMIVIDSSRGDPAAWWPSAPLGRGDLDIPAFVNMLRGAGFAGTLFVEMANMHPDWADEDLAVRESVAYLSELLTRS